VDLVAFYSGSISGFQKILIQSYCFQTYGIFGLEKQFKEVQQKGTALNQCPEETKVG
jgi:hypothetical protein